MCYKERLAEILNNVEDIIQEEHDATKYFLNELFNLLFWKDYSCGYVDINLKRELIGLMDIFTKRKSGSDEWYNFDDMDEVYKVVSKVRKAIGIKEELP